MLPQTVILPFILALRFCKGSWTEPVSYKHPGNITIAGLFPLHYISDRPDNYSLEEAPEALVCRRYNFLGFRWMQAMIFAIQEINNRSDILPNISLGWQLFDTCNTHARAVTQALHVVDSIYKRPKSLSALIGPTASDKSIVVSNILSVFDVPQISYGSTSRLLSNKNIYNSFLRTIPNDDEQATAMVELLLHHNWTWVGAVAGDDDYGRPGISRFKEEAEKHGICVEYTAYVSESMSEEHLKQTAREIKNYNATVFVTFISATHLVPLARYLSEYSVTDKVWIASEAWATSDTVRAIDARVFQGTLGIATRGGEMPGFRAFLEGVSPKTQPESPYITEFWEKSFQCNCPDTVCAKTENDGGMSSHNSYAENCTGNESLTGDGAITSAYLGWTDLEKSYTTYLAVYVVASALHNISTCVEGKGLLKNGACPYLNNLTTWQLLSYIKKVDFFPPGHDYKTHNDTFNFDENGDPNASYKLVSWIPKMNCRGNITVDFVHVGNYSSMVTPKWSINESAIYWHKHNDIPKSVCNADCQPGYYKIQLQSACCFKCAECPSGEYSVDINSPVCTPCNLTHRADDNRTSCIPKNEEYIRWSDAFGVTFCVLSGIGILLTLFTAGSFMKMRRTPLVKATNRELSFLLFLSIFCCFLTPLLYLGKPQDWNCKGRTVTFSLSFTFCIAAILVKTLRVLTAFEARIPVTYKKRTKWLGEHVQVFVVMVVSLVQVILSVTWLVVDPPKVMLSQSKTSDISLIVECNVGNLVIMGFVYGYLCLLALTAFVFAFRARKLPENFNEAKFITFSMLIFFIVWLSFIPAYLSTTGINATAVSCIAILSSTFALLACIFFPKLYVIYWTPQRNTVEEVRQNTATHAIRSSRSVAYSVRIKPPDMSSDSNKSMVQETSPPRTGRKGMYGRNANDRNPFKDFDNSNFNNSNNINLSSVSKASNRRLKIQNRNRSHSLQPERLRMNLNNQDIYEDVLTTTFSKDINRFSGQSEKDSVQSESSSTNDTESTTFNVDIAGKISTDTAITDRAENYEKILFDDGKRINLKVAVKVNIQQTACDKNAPSVQLNNNNNHTPLETILPTSEQLANRPLSECNNTGAELSVQSSRDDITTTNNMFDSSSA
uniref:extracellular calcium-sensing receptor-like isoform X2 n=1 Tax=Ciona intestinalis TaxID=7719 RepID=UPI0002B8CF10|nr:extracellular calcium-sensing receptor-like isoform X2 [Ciona intestinalis]|eukprot:XP_018669868.1 extracellular calcium-sensing receptor-like isoform X2 [Ciona intestinalis]